MSELEEQINRILSDPAQMEKLSGLASLLMGGESGEAAPSPAPAPDPGLLQKLGGALGGGAAGKETALLEAMRPWLSEKRRHKMDRALQLAKMARIARLALGQMGGGDDDQPL